MAYTTFIAKSTIDNASGGAGAGATAQVPYMGSILAGDLLIILGMTNCPGATTAQITGPAGWTALGSGSYSTDIPALVGAGGGWYKIAAGTETGTEDVFGFSDAAIEVVAQMYQYRVTNPGETIIIEDSEFFQNNGSTTVTWNAVNVSSTHRTLVALSGADASGPSVPAGYTNEASDSDLGLFLACDGWEDVSSDGLVTASGGSNQGWFTIHLSMYGAMIGSTRSFIVN